MYTPTPNDVSKLQRFTPLKEEDVHKVVISLKTKSCELDPIPTTTFKKLLPAILPLITKIVNISLSEGLLIRSWKTAVV